MVSEILAWLAAGMFAVGAGAFAYASTEAAKNARHWHEQFLVSEEHYVLARERNIKAVKKTHEYALEKGRQLGFSEGVEHQRTSMLTEVGRPHRIARVLGFGGLRPGDHERFRNEAIEVLLKEGLAIRSEFAWMVDMTPPGRSSHGREIVLEAYVLTTPLAPAPNRLSMSPQLFEYNATTTLEPR